MGNSCACCATDQNKTDKYGQPLQSQEVLGVDEKAPAPGFHTKAEIGVIGNRPDAPNGGSAGGGAKTDGEGDETLNLDDGSTYQGQVVDGKRHGQGVWQSRTGQYDGQWKDDMQHGTGSQTWSDGRCYHGQFVQGKFSGKGKMEWHTAKGYLTYDGEYVDDLKEGSGKFSWADGRHYTGEWSKGKRHGKGVYTNAKGETKSGFWAQDKFAWLEEDEAREIPTNKSG